MSGPKRGALVVGASSGIGRATVLALAARGRVVGAVARSESGLADLQAEAEPLPGAVFTWVCDAGRHDELTRTLDAALATLPPVDVAVHAAASVFPVGPIHTCDPAAIAASVAVNVTSAFVTAQHLLARFPQHGGGVLGLLSSGAARRVATYRATYSATKAAVDQFVTVVGAELRESGAATGITALYPGRVDTPMQDGLQSAARSAAHRQQRDALVEFSKPAAGLRDPADVANWAVDLLLRPAAELNGRILSLQHHGWVDVPVDPASEQPVAEILPTS